MHARHPQLRLQSRCLNSQSFGHVEAWPLGTSGAKARSTAAPLGTAKAVPSRIRAPPRGAPSPALPGLFRLLQFFRQGGHDLENVADHAIIGNFENGRVLIFVDGDDSA